MWRLTPAALECLESQFPGETPSRIVSALRSAVWLPKYPPKNQGDQAPANYHYAAIWSPFGEGVIVAVVEYDPDYEEKIVLRFFRAWNKAQETLKTVIIGWTGNRPHAVARLSPLHALKVMSAAGIAVPETLASRQQISNFVRSETHKGAAPSTWHLTPMALEVLSAEYPGETPSRVISALQTAVWLPRDRLKYRHDRASLFHHYAVFWSPSKSDVVIAVVDYDEKIVLRFFRAWDRQRNELKTRVFEQIGGKRFPTARINPSYVVKAILAAGAGGESGTEMPLPHEYIDFIRSYTQPEYEPLITNGKFTLSSNAVNRLSSLFPKVTPENAMESLENAFRIHKDFSIFPGNRVPEGNDYLLFWSIPQATGIVAIVSQDTKTVLTFLPAWQETEDGGYGTKFFEIVDGIKGKTGYVTPNNIQRAKELAGLKPAEKTSFTFELSIRLITASGIKVARAGSVACTPDQLPELMAENKASAIEKAIAKGALSATMTASRRGNVNQVHEIVLIEAPTQSGWLNCFPGNGTAG